MISSLVLMFFLSSDFDSSIISPFPKIYKRGNKKTFFDIFLQKVLTNWNERGYNKTVPKRELKNQKGENDMTINLKRLKAERIASGMTQDEVAHRMGWKTRTPYAKRENGIVSIGADELAKITLIFGLPMEKITIFFDNSVPEREQLLA